MNKLIKTSLVVIAAIALFSVFQACRKPKCPPEDPCLNPVTVTALDREMFVRGHFSYTDNNQNYWLLYVTNWSDYAAKVMPGKQYQISFNEVQCKDNDYLNNGILKGGCMMQQRKCIVIKCLTEIKDKGCFGSVVNPQTFDNEYSQAVSATGIVGNTLNVKLGFSGCTDAYKNSFKLYLQLQPDLTMGPNSKPVFMAKAVNTVQDITCMAYFEKEVCFDLSAIRQWYYASNYAPFPKKVIIRMKLGYKMTDFEYQL